MHQVNKTPTNTRYFCSWGWTYYEVNKGIITESDLKICELINTVIKQAQKNGITKNLICQRLHISRTMLHYIVHGHNNGLSYLRYMPKLLALLRACDCHLQLNVTPINQGETIQRKKGIK